MVISGLRPSLYWSFIIIFGSCGEINFCLTQQAKNSFINSPPLEFSELSKISFLLNIF